MKQKVVAFTGGGTAGHVMPNLSIMETLQQQNQVKCHYIGLKDGIEQKIIGSSVKIPYHVIHSAKFNRSLRFSNLFELRWLLKGIQEAKKVLQEIQPDLIFSKGGYVSFPVVIAGYQKHIPMIAHESDITPGLANRWSAKFVNKILTAFPETTAYYPKKSQMVGTPIRSYLLQGDREKGFSITHLPKEKPVVLVMGGSQGSVFINQHIRSLLPILLVQYSILHICGTGHLDASLQERKGYFQIEFAMEELAHFYAMSDLVISRAGANSIMELAALQKPSILIPLSRKYSRGDQIANATSFEKHGLSLKLEEEDITGTMIPDTLKWLWNNRDAFQQKMKQFFPSNTTEKVCEIISNYW
ncbi:MAG: undecaprenyldiphospho-muramoylpentapeptide beta-N-acetylglucosaminyltransferase [Caldisericia bacterium]|nr:undecaprenyldiphospho-muramoylpentapeptide beta-N-acetylglucosaminyltransferase [Caldisericia bacterium]